MEMLKQRATNNYRKLSRLFTSVLGIARIPLHDDGVYLHPLPCGQYTSKPVLDIEESQQRLRCTPIFFAGESPCYGSKYTSVELHDGEP